VPARSRNMTYVAVTAACQCMPFLHHTIQHADTQLSQATMYEWETHIDVWCCIPLGDETLWHTHVR
jgi:hypothetical protein